MVREPWEHASGAKPRRAKRSEARPPAARRGVELAIQREQPHVASAPTLPRSPRKGASR